MDNSKVLIYIQRYLASSPLGLYFGKVSKEDWTRDWEHIEDGPSLLEMLDKQIEKQEMDVPHMKAFPQMDFLVNYLSTRANSVFKVIAGAEKRSVHFWQPVKMDIGSPIAMYDMRMGVVPKLVSIVGDKIPVRSC